eukprot:7773539-Prorocentrum_lima.AAC.1
MTMYQVSFGNSDRNIIGIPHSAHGCACLTFFWMILTILAWCCNRNNAMMGVWRKAQHTYFL